MFLYPRASLIGRALVLAVKSALKVRFESSIAVLYSIESLSKVTVRGVLCDHRRL